MSDGDAVQCLGEYKICLFRYDRSYLACIGDDDATDDRCTIKSVPDIFEGDVLDHLGPYQGIYLGSCS